MEYDRRKFLKISWFATVALAVAGSVETSATEHGGPRLLADPWSPLPPTPTPGPECSAACSPTAVLTPTVAPTSTPCPTPAANLPGEPGDPGNICLINELAQSIQGDLQQIVENIDNAGCGHKDRNRSRVSAIKDLLSDPADDADSAADQLDTLALVLRKIKIPKQATKYARPSGKDQSVNYWLNYIDGLLRDLFARLQGECNDKKLGKDFRDLGGMPDASKSIAKSVDDIRNVFALVKQHLKKHHFCKDCKNFRILQASKA